MMFSLEQRFSLMITFSGLAICGTIPVTLASRQLMASLLVSDLLQNYSSDLRPGLDQNSPLNVNVTFNLVSLTQFNEVEGYMSTVCYIRVEWVDDRMSWDRDVYGGIDEMTVRSDKVWTPELVLGNAADKITTFTSMDTVVRYYSGGHAVWMPGDVLKTTCFIQIPGYPFDEHTCWIQIVLWGHNLHEATLQTPLNHMITYLYSDNTVWEKLGTQATVSDNPLVSMVTFGLTLARRPAFHVINIILPIVFLSLMNIQVFLLPIGCGERVSFAVTMLLSFTVFQTVVSDNIPKTSSPMPYLCYYIISVLVTSGCIIITTVVSQNMYHAPPTKPVPQWLKWLVGQSHKVDVATATDSGVCGDLSQHGDNACLQIQKATEADITEDEGQPIRTDITWHHVSVCLDRYFFLLFLVTAVALAVGFIGVMLSNRRYQQ